MNYIEEFWQNKINNIYNTKELLIENITKYYEDEFINNYTKWKNLLNSCNTDYKSYFIKLYNKKEYWTDMSYDYFTKNIINFMVDHIKINNNIESKDVHLLLGIILDEYFYQQELKIPQELIDKKNDSNINNLLESIKQIVYKKSDI